MQSVRPTRRELERETARDMLAVRVTEMRDAWLINRNELMLCQSHVTEDLQRWVAASNAVRAAQEELADAHQQMALLKEAAVAADAHPLFSLHARHAAHIRAETARAQAAAMLQEACAQSTQQNSNIQVSSWPNLLSCESLRLMLPGCSGCVERTRVA